MARRYHASPLPETGPVLLPEDVGHHVARVMRARVGDVVTLFDGSGRECDATLAAIEGGGHQLRVTATVGAHRPCGREPQRRIEVAFAPPKGNRVEWLFEHGTEVGIAAFHPVRTGRAAAGAERRERWTRIATAATGQCDRGAVPAIHASRPLADFLADQGLPAERYLADAAGPPLAAAGSDHAILLVGPEGGFTAAEVESARDHGFAPRSLGVTTLRTETAVVAGAVLLLQG